MPSSPRTASLKLLTALEKSADLERWIGAMASQNNIILQDLMAIMQAGRELCFRER
jgi:hypothetical protein